MLLHFYRAAQSRELPSSCSEDGRTVSNWVCGVVNGLLALSPERLLPEIRSWTCTRSPPGPGQGPGCSLARGLVPRPGRQALP